MDYEFHAESKCADPEGNPSDQQTIGLLQRRHVHIELIKYIGKESNSLEEVEAGLHHSPENVYTEYVDPRRDEWAIRILPALRNFPPQFLADQTGLSLTTIKDALAERSRPYLEHRKRLAVIWRQFQK